MKNFLTVFALMVSVSGVAVSLAREEVRCYLGLSSTACQANQSPLHTPKANSSSSSTAKSSTASSSQTQKTQESEEKTPFNLPTSVQELTKVGKDLVNPSSSSDSSSEVINPSTTTEEPPAAPPEVSKQPTEAITEVSSPSTYAEPITEPVELEVIPPPENPINSSQPTQN